MSKEKTKINYDNVGKAPDNGLVDGCAVSEKVGEGSQDGYGASDREKFIAYMNGNNEFMVMCVGGDEPKVLRWHIVGVERLIGWFFADNVGLKNVAFHPIPCEWNCIFPTINEIRKDMPLFADLVFQIFFRGTKDGRSPWKSILTKIARDQIALKHTIRQNDICGTCLNFIVHKCDDWVDSQESLMLMRTGELHAAILKVLATIDGQWNARKPCKMGLSIKSMVGTKRSR